MLVRFTQSTATEKGVFAHGQEVEVVDEAVAQDFIDRGLAEFVIPSIDPDPPDPEAPIDADEPEADDPESVPENDEPDADARAPETATSKKPRSRAVSVVLGRRR